MTFNTTITTSYYYYITFCLFSRKIWVSWHQKGKPVPFWILLEHDTMGWQWQPDHMQSLAPRSRQITMPVLYHLMFYRPDALPAAQPTASKH